MLSHVYNIACKDCGKILTFIQNGFFLGEDMAYEVFSVLHENSYDSLVYYAEEGGVVKLIDVDVL
jgi:hypothetical protein